MVRYAAAQIDNLCPQVINAARILAARPRSKVAQENMEVFKQAWENQVRILTEAVDDITTIDDFLAVSENHILEDVNKCVLALQEGNKYTYITCKIKSLDPKMINSSFNFSWQRVTFRCHECIAER